MSLCINPQETDIQVKVNGGYVILKVRSATVEETRKYRKSMARPSVKRNQLDWKDESSEHMIEVMDDLLIDVAALDDSGFKTALTFTDTSGEELPLDKSVEGWKSFISESIKLKAGEAFFRIEAEIGEELIKN